MFIFIGPRATGMITLLCRRKVFDTKRVLHVVASRSGIVASRVVGLFRDKYKFTIAPWSCYRVKS